MFPRSLRTTLLSLLPCLFAGCLSQIVYPGAYMEDAGMPPLAAQLPGGRAVAYRMADGTLLRGWLWERGAHAPLVVVYGGNCMDVGDFADLAQRDRRRSYLFVNYRGYGMSEGEPGEEELVADARALLRQVRQQMKHQGKVALLGYSLGTGVATQVAAAEAVDALILACPFDSLLAVCCHHVPLLPRLLPMDRFRSDLAAPKVRCPVTIFLGEQDTVVPPVHSERLAKCFTQAPVQLHRFPCGHNSIFGQEGVHKALRKALEAMEK